MKTQKKSGYIKKREVKRGKGAIWGKSLSSSRGASKRKCMGVASVLMAEPKRKLNMTDKIR